MTNLSPLQMFINENSTDHRHMTIRGKNLMRYQIIYSIPEGGGVAKGMLEAEPTRLPGGAQIPTAFFREPLTETILEGDDKDR